MMQITISSRMPADTCRTIVVIGLMLALAGCGHEQVRRLPSGNTAAAVGGPVAPASRPRPGETAARYALDQLGVPYRYGGSGSNGFDCSGLVQYAWSRAGRSIPRTTRDQYRQLSAVGRRELRTGDLLFFRIGGKISHVGMYLGGNRFVHAPSSGQTVTTASLDSDFYRDRFVRAGRP